MGSEKAVVIVGTSTLTGQATALVADKAHLESRLRMPKSLRIQIAQSRHYLHILGPKVGVAYTFGPLANHASVQPAKHGPIPGSSMLLAHLRQAQHVGTWPNTGVLQKILSPSIDPK